MRKILETIAIFLLVFLLKPASADEFSVAALTNYPPYSFYTREGGWKGYGIDVANRLIRTPTDEHSLDYMVNPSWGRAIKSIETGDLDILWEVSYTPERALFMEYIGVTDVERLKLIVPETARIDTITDLDQFFEVGPKMGYESSFIVYSADAEYGTEFDERMHADRRFESIFHDDFGIDSDLGDIIWAGMLVSMGRIPARLMSESDAIKAVKESKKLAESESNAIRLKAVSIPAFGDPVTYFVTSKVMSEEHKQLIKSNYAQARKDGSFETIWKKWFGDRNVPPNLPTK